MKHLNKKKLNTAIFALIMAFAVASSAYASEITGTLRSSGDNNPPEKAEQPAPEATGTDSSVSGSVDSGSGSSSSSNTTSSGSSTSRTSSTSSGSSSSSFPTYESYSAPQESGEVLGASRTASPATSGTSSPRSSSGSLSPSPSSNNELAAEEDTNSVTSPYFNLEDEPSTSITPAESPILDAGSWFWIIMISLFLVAAAAYYLTRPTDELERI